MSIFSRIKNMTKAKINDRLDEMENPIELLDQKVRDMEKSLNEAKISSAQVLGNVHEIKSKMEKAKQESEDYDKKVKLAMSKENEELAKKALKKKIDADKNYNSLKTSYDQAKVKAETLKKRLRELQEEIEKTRSYRDEAAARFNNAEASKKVNEIISNVSTKKDDIRIDDIERKIQKKEALAEGLGDLKETSLEDEFAELEEVDLESELEKYR
ncbi:PspA/IM30 family protein [Haloimpatiens sp. FM7330]|uniref:PspA/IM30 family protein n=1 Tax=Haloimpatiens sp. FM7330 TaxID=3298610 RepID=UPI00362E1394